MRILHAVVVAAIALAPSFCLGQECTLPTGIDFGGGSCNGGEKQCINFSVFNGIANLDTILRSVITAVNGPKPGLSGIETPIVNHWTSSNLSQIYNAMAAYEEKALEVWGRRGLSDRRRRCRGGDVPEDQFLLHRRVTLAYTGLWVFSTTEKWTIPAGGAEVPLRELAKEWGLNYDLCDIDRTRRNDFMNNCDDISTPWGLAISLVDEILDWFSRDGWNHDGKLGGPENNLNPYRDWRSRQNRYVPVNDPWELDDNRRWQPLLEHDGNGFLYRQDHVTPHIGETAKSIFLTDEEICRASLELSGPDYDLEAEAKLTLQRVAQLTEREKAKIELYDNKLISLSPLVGQYYGRQGIVSDDFIFLVAQLANIQALREATILVWRSKVEFDLIRPNTYVQTQFGDQIVESYGGPDVGETVQLKASDWQPYRRVMPHSEYPSGSSCLCRAFADALTVITGSDEFKQPSELTLTRFNGTSNVEAGRPSQDERFTYKAWSEVTRDCGQSRLSGGMHFTAAVPKGEELCANVGATVANKVLALSKGEDPGYIIDFDFPKEEIREVRCPSAFP